MADVFFTIIPVISVRIRFCIHFRFSLQVGFIKRIR